MTPFSRTFTLTLYQVQGRFYLLPQGEREIEEEKAQAGTPVLSIEWETGVGDFPAPRLPRLPTAVGMARNDTLLPHLRLTLYQVRGRL